MQSPIIIRGVRTGLVKKDGPNKGKHYSVINYDFPATTKVNAQIQAKGHTHGEGVVMANLFDSLEVGASYSAEFEMQEGKLVLQEIIDEIKPQSAGAPPK